MEFRAFGARISLDGITESLRAEAFVKGFVNDGNVRRSRHTSKTSSSHGNSKTTYSSDSHDWASVEEGGNVPMIF